MDHNESISLNPQISAERERKGIPGSTLKLIAIITMLIDHTAATILDRILASGGMNLTQNANAAQEFYAKYGLIYYTDMFMRAIGRLGFPIFCFLLVEGFLHTRNVRKYAMRLAMFALISEIPFDLAFEGKIFYLKYQNVFFTLLIGLLVMTGFKAVKEKLQDVKWLPVLAVIGAIEAGCSLAFAPFGIVRYVKNYLISFGMNLSIFTDGLTILLAIVFSVAALMVLGFMGRKISFKAASLRFADLAVLVSGMILAEILMTDYSGFGVLTIAVMYGLRRDRLKSMLGGCITLTVMSLFEATCFFTLIPARLYNGQRGLKLKYVFYLFYPVHLFILYMICYFMKIA